MASVAVTGQTSILSNSLVEAWVFPGAGTTDHSADEHIADPPEVTVGAVIAGTGFTIYGTAWLTQAGTWVLGQSAPQGSIVMPYGQWNIAWVWS